MNRTILYLVNFLIVLVTILGYTCIGYLTYLWFSTIAAVGHDPVANRVYEILGFIITGFLLNALIIVSGLPLIFMVWLCLNHLLQCIYECFLKCERKGHEESKITPLKSEFIIKH